MSNIPQAATVKKHHKLSWKPHIDYICNKANRTIGFLKCNLHHCLNCLKKQFVIPVLDYTVCPYGTLTTNHI